MSELWRAGAARPDEPAWHVTVRCAPAADLHGLELPVDGRRHVWVHEPTRPALVLGSTQAESVADTTALKQRGIELVRRRSGGGAVLLDPDHALWVDVVIPRSDRLWDEDVTASFRWLGHAWQRALAAHGIDSEVHRSAPERTPWSALVCFAGVGTGEVLVGGRKVVGLSQRRTRSVARFQCVAYLGDPLTASDVVDLLAEPAAAAERAALATWLWCRTSAVPVIHDALLRTLLAALPSGA